MSGSQDQKERKTASTVTTIFFPFLITVSGWCSCFDVLNFNHLFNSTSVAIVALAIRAGVFLSQ